MGNVAEALAQDGERPRRDRQHDLGLVADPVAVDLQRDGPPVGRPQDDLLLVREAADLAVVEDPQALGEQPQRDPRDVQRGGPVQDDAGEVAAVERRAYRTCLPAKR